ncbi:probable LRR receptor-like serine/threonine-protein kinase RKF3 [Phragmites australis]|uniref:probable LRR receptor-like serine/threonine-protein kinase RKF3 n=1 Tax=Phragmites australis TaxID=29695 RepID=UPI002D77C0EE|nr:probable LRR receptor-like serine/threonine-protein kinase RKF3 [Phragmites australis]
MSRPHLLPLLLVLVLLPIPLHSQPAPITSTTPPPPQCALNFTALRPFLAPPLPADDAFRCSLATQSVAFLLSLQLAATDSFVLPHNASSCLSPLRVALPFPLPACGGILDGLDSLLPSPGCGNVSTLADFDALVPPSARGDMDASCDRDLSAVPDCTVCTTALSKAAAAYLLSGSHNSAGSNNVTGCAQYPFIYAGAKASPRGPADPATAYCLYLLKANPPPAATSGTAPWVYGVAFGCLGAVLLVAAAAGSCFLVRRRQARAAAEALAAATADSRSKRSQAMESINASTTLVKFTYDDIKAATGGFARESIIGRGGFGNVYKGVLPDGAEVAVKRFKNCSAAGDTAFAHEVEVVASVRHINLVTLCGYCTATTQREGHQRMIVCDLMHNGSLHDHLFGAGECQMSWPVRQRIAVGMARGLAYLHRGAQPAIIHRDIKASNILLDDEFEAKVADFGLAKFAPEGMTHVSTRVAGTLGYVAPEYALYGQLTEKSDVYSFGVVLLELLSGKRAFISLGEGQSFVLTDWAWSLVRRGKTVDVIQEGMLEPGPTEVMEKYVLIGALCTHPQLHARPTMEQALKILEADSAPSPLIIPERPLPVVANLGEIERSASSGGFGQLFSPSGFRSFIHGIEDTAMASPNET